MNLHQLYCSEFTVLYAPNPYIEFANGRHTGMIPTPLQESRGGRTLTNTANYRRVANRRLNLVSLQDKAKETNGVDEFEGNTL